MIGHPTSVRVGKLEGGLAFASQSPGAGQRAMTEAQLGEVAALTSTVTARPCATPINENNAGQFERAASR